MQLAFLAISDAIFLGLSIFPKRVHVLKATLVEYIKTGCFFQVLQTYYGRLISGNKRGW